MEYQKVDRKAWFPVSSSKGLSPGSVMAVELLGEELAVWRAEDESIHAWVDRCPHRGMRLSKGFVRDNSLNCLYHGWQFGTDAGCKRIPAQPDMKVPPAVCASSYSACDAGGLIWVSLDKEPRDQPSVNANVTFCRSIALDAGVDLIVEKLCSAVFPFPGMSPCPEDAVTLAQSAVSLAETETESGAGRQVAWSASPKESIQAADSELLGRVEYDSVCEDGVIRVTATRSGQAQADTEEIGLSFYLQPVNEDKTQLHLLIEADSSGYRQSALNCHFSKWLQRLRWFIENRDGSMVKSYSAWV